MRCETCGHDLQIGDYPFCGKFGGHERGFSTIIGDEIDYWDDNLTSTPIHITSKQQRKRLMKEYGVQECVRHVGVAGTDKSPHTVRWVTTDPQTLENARVLVTRQQEADARHA